MRNQPARAVTVASLLFAGTLASQCSGTPAQPESRAPFKPVATVDEVMDGIVIPSAQAIFDAVVYSNGELLQAPKTDDDWFNLRIHALAIAEAGNLLMMPPRARDAGDWVKMSLALNDRAMTAARAAEKRDLDALLKAGGDMYDVCTACHEKYAMPEGQ
ncbi:MAG TPA: hypothetical protein VIX63_05390 [Vicinamibacterales bacterium]